MYNVYINLMYNISSRDYKVNSKIKNIYYLPKTTQKPQ
jgi:hypothetical protein